ncbi:hypothetical protein A3749_11395, partial [Oleiphilus sp. HI0078]
MLKIVEKIIEDFDQNEIKFCHWKSNQRLVEACSGVGDLDILFDRTEYHEVTSILTKCGFKRLESHIDRQFPGVEDYVGFDQSSGKLVHLQAHFSLVTGQPLVKNYRFSIERLLLDNLIIHTDTGMYVPRPEIEAFIHVYRTFIKTGLNKVVRRKLFKSLSSKAKDELEYLLSQVDENAKENLFKRVFPNLSYERYLEAEKAMLSGVGYSDWVSVRRKVIKDLEVYERRSKFRTVVTWFIRRIFLLFCQKVLKSSPKRKLSSGGLGVAIVGSDGAGKSTANKKLRAWLGEYIELRYFHMGKPPKSLLTIFLA